jgi:glycosyltransferase involved in cell wall biosynthesis
MFSIIICTYNRDKYIYEALRSLAENRFPVDEYEIVLVNNNSTDNTEKECNRFHNDYKNIDFKYFVEKEQGLSFARNRGIKESDRDFLVFLDDDAFVSEDYLQKLKEYLHLYPNLKAFGGRIIPLFETKKVPVWYSVWSSSFVSSLDKGNKVREFSGKSFPIGANMGFYKSCLEYTGVFDSSLGRCGQNLIGGEEKDLFQRFRKKNYKIYYLPETEVRHVIPENRTTYDYIRKLGEGVGISESIRCKNIGFFFLAGRYLSEIFKWGVSLILWIWYAIQGKFPKGYALLLFRWYVTKGLLKGYKPSRVAS